MHRAFASIGARISLVTVIFGLGLLALTAKSVWDFRDTLVENRKAELASLVESAKNVVAYYESQASAGAISMEEAKSRARSAVAAMRYRNGEYFFISDMTTHVVMHPIKPELDGTDASSMSDPNGKRMFVAFTDTVRQGGRGHVDYMWPKPGAADPKPKLSYVEGFAPWGWIIGTGVYVDDIDASVRTMALFLSSIGCAILALALTFSIPLILSIVRPLRSMTSTMLRLSNGETSLDIQGAERRDEIGDMAKAMAVFKDNAIRMAQLRQQREDDAKEAEASRRAEMNSIADEFEVSVKRIVEKVASASSELTAASSDLTRIAEESTDQTSRVSHQAQEAAVNVSAVASAAEELSASIAEIAQQSTRSAEVAHEAEGRNTEMQATVRALAEAANRIGEVVTTIGAIAGQTNLLALNATIEAARAGEAGKGFAVVASEVKELSSQTRRATEEIAAQVKDIQDATAMTVGSIESMGATIVQVSSIAGAIASAVEEQRAVVAEISRTSLDVAAATDSVSTNVEAVRSGIESTSAAAEQSRASAEGLGREASRLDEAVTNFLVRVRG